MHCARDRSMTDNKSVITSPLGVLPLSWGAALTPGQVWGPACVSGEG